LISQVHRAGRRVFARMLKAEEVDLNPAQGRILFALWREEGVPIETLAKRTGLRPSTLTRMLDRLEKSGHLRREPSETDRRKHLVFTIQVREELRERYDRVSAEMSALFYKGFSDRDIDRFEADLERILGNLAEAERAGGRTTRSGRVGNQNGPGNRDR